jgi:N-acetylglucosaminyl-diphospho-decaprenol L-rhamnosyltransferase
MLCREIRRNGDVEYDAPFAKKIAVSPEPDERASLRAEKPSQTPQPTVDVVVVSWNTRDDLLACLDALAQSRGVALDAVVVDNDSLDGSATAVAASHPDVHLIRNRSNAGFSRAVNQGLRQGTAAWVLLLNPDAMVQPDTVASLVARLEALPRHAAVAPRLLHADGRPQHSVYPYPTLWLSLVLALSLQRLLPRRVRARLLLEGDWQSDVERDVPWAIGACLLLRRSVVDELGPLDERFFVYAEDLEWCHRVTHAGHPIRFVPGLSVTHLGNRSGEQRYGDDRTAAWLSNTVRFARAAHGPLWAWAYVAVNGAATVSRWAAATALLRVRRNDARMRRARLWRAHARFYLRRAPRRRDEGR